MVVGDDRLCGLYAVAMRLLGVAGETVPGEAALIEGLKRIHHE
jgi:2-keto-3-deoxy-galactonokinase